MLWQPAMSAIESKTELSAGCLPTLATIPVFWGLYRTLSNVSQAGLLTEGFYWIPSLSGPASLADQRAGTPSLPLITLDWRQCMRADILNCNDKRMPIMHPLLCGPWCRHCSFLGRVHAECR